MAAQAEMKIVTTTDQSVSAESSSQLLASDRSRFEGIIQLLSSAPADCRVGDSNVASNQGVQLQPGESLTLRTTNAIHAFNPDSATAANFSLLEVRGYGNQ